MLIKLLIIGVLLVSVDLNANVTLVAPEQSLIAYGVKLDNVSLIEALASDKPAIRQYAAEILGNRRVRSADGPLRTLLSDKYVYARVSAAVAVIKLDDPSGFLVLHDVIQNSDPEAALFAADLLTGVGSSDGYDRLEGLIKSSEASERVREAALRIMAKMVNLKNMRGKVERNLCDALISDPATNVRRAASSELIRIGSTNSVPVFQRALTSDSDEEVRELAKAFLLRAKLGSLQK